MTFLTLVKRSLRFYWRTHTGVLLGIAIGTAILVGALVVGDSVKYTLKTLALLRLGKVQLALATQNRYFSTTLADSLESALNTATAPVLQMRGIAANGDGSARVNHIQVLGVDERFWTLAFNKPAFNFPSEDEVIVNKQLASHIGVKEGEDVLLRVEKPSLLPRDAPMAIGEGYSLALRMTVKSVISDLNLGRFSLQASQIAPFNAFVPIEWLQQKLNLPGRANMLMIGSDKFIDFADADAALRDKWELKDAELKLQEVPGQDMIELRTDRIFLDPAVADAAKQASPGAIRILTYFVNEIRLGHRTTPYSIVSAIEPAESQTSPVMRQISEMGDDEILINEWLADDLQAKSGDILEMTYFAFGSMRKLEEHTSNFRVRAILPMEGDAVDPQLMPGFPGLYDVNNCRDWEPGIPIDLNKIRKKDEKYWDIYRGTPKAFITLKVGQNMWSNRFGDLTAIRYPLQKGSQIETAIKRNLDPASVGLLFQPVRQQALMASSQAIDFGQLFLGLSLFLIVAAAMLTGLLFVFGIEQRKEETGTLLALGFTPRQVQRLFLLEGGILALIGGFLGTGAGIWYTRATLYLLSTVWRGAVGTADFQLFAKPLTLIAGALAGMFMGLLAIWLTSRRQVKHPARELLVGEIEAGYSILDARYLILDTRYSMETSSNQHPVSSIQHPARKLRPGLLLSAVSGIAALIILATASAGRDTRAVGAFFGSGALLLICCLGLNHALLTRKVASSHISLRGLGLRNSARRWGRSLATVGILACGSFLIIAIGANQHNALEGAEKRQSGTGGFALYAESTLPILHDLNSEEGRKVYGFAEMEDVEFVQFRVRDGEDASCLNLNRAQNPNLLGTRPEKLHGLGAFKFVKTIGKSDEPWLLLNRKDSENTVSAIGDQNTISWSLGKSVGDIIPYTDEKGQVFNIRIVGAIANSILQGSFVLSEDEFTKRFPSESGYRVFLINTPSDSAKAKTLTTAFQDVGMDLTPAVERLAAFNAVENTYLSIFQVLGGLAILLGSFGLGILVLRNVMERRGELALMRAVGFDKRSLQWLVLSEHWLLLFLGLASGIISGLLAVAPVLRSPGVSFPYISLIITLCLIALNGVLWTWFATRLTLRGPLLAALRNE